MSEDALQGIVQQTPGYPYFLQKWGKHAWDIPTASPITRTDVERASKEAVAAFDESFFRVRFDRLTPLEKKYLRHVDRQPSGLAAATLARNAMLTAAICSCCSLMGIVAGGASRKRLAGMKRP